MYDEIFDRNYQAGRADLNAGLDLLARRVGRSVTVAFDALHRIQFAAPWTKRRRTARCA